MTEPQESQSDDELMQAFGEGSEKALQSLIQRYQGRLFNFIWRHTGDRQVAEDLFQETFIRLYKSRLRYRAGETGFRSYLYTIALNLCRDYHRSRYRRKEDLAWSTEQVVAKEPKSPTGGPDEDLSSRRREKLVWDLLATLPEKEKTVLTLSRFEGMAYGEIAKILGTTPGMIKQYAFRGLRRLRKDFQKKGLGDKLDLI